MRREVLAQALEPLAVELTPSARRQMQDEGHSRGLGVIIVEPVELGVSLAAREQARAVIGDEDEGPSISSSSWRMPS
jgi:hypothetical protein